ncbi:MAG: hypothetical protein ACJ71B_02255 [Nitrososphaera sp.]
MIPPTMKSVNTSGLVLGMLAVGGLIAGGAFMTGQAVFATAIGEDPELTVDPTNAAAAANSNNQPVTQTNAAAIGQESHTYCKASVSDDDLAQVGSNTNTAANDCDTTQSAAVGQSNSNTQTTTQNALAIACQANSLLASSAICGNSGDDEE